jgi:hypothetical protein
MIVIIRKNEWLKEILMIEEGKERLQQHSNYGWSFVDYLHTPINTPKLDKWNCFVDKFKSMPKNIQELILKKYMEVLKSSVYNFVHPLLTL